jgi:hypothetical protein
MYNARPTVNLKIPSAHVVRKEYTPEELGVGFIVRVGPGQAVCSICGDNRPFDNSYKGRLTHTRGARHKAAVARQKPTT